MSSHLGEYIQSQRKAAGLRIVEVARLAGLRDKPKMLRRLEGWSEPAIRNQKSLLPLRRS